LLFFDLDRPGDAKPHLEAVRHGDPEGIGADRMVLSALETIYEDSGDVDGRADILRARLETASSEEMRETYRMLLAQLHWEDDGDARRAERWLEEILQRDPTHEGAHRLHAEIAEARGDYDAAADHLASVLEVAGDGLDAVEIQRELADMLLEDLERPEEAKRHYEEVLEASPGDARALEGIQACQRATGDSRGLLESLARELGLLIGRPQGISPLEMSDINPSEVDEGARIPAAQILGDAAEIVEKEMGDVNGARQLWETARRVWPDYVEALERRISLDRRLGDNDALAKGLEALADHLIDGDQKVETLGDAAGIYAERLDDPKEARRVLGRAIRVAQDESLGSERIDELAQRRKRLGDSEGSS
jgi:tetratricopeptide (TPR) repeat protein